MAFTLAGCAHGQPFRQPELIRWGASAADLAPAIQSQCASWRVRRIDPPFLPDVADKQMQIDCEGFLFFGRDRHVEFVIRDDRLVMVWLMVTQDETDTTIAALTRAFGAPTHRNANYVAFESRRIAWRFHPAEILFYAPELDADMAPDFR